MLPENNKPFNIHVQVGKTAENNRYHSISSFVGDAGYHYPLATSKINKK